MANRKVNVFATSWSGIRAVVVFRRLLHKRPFLFAIILSFVVSTLLVIFGPDKVYTVLLTTCDLIVAVFPSLLGFSLGGYALIIGFSNSELMEHLAKDQDWSLFQALSGIFAFSLLFQVFSTIIAATIIWGIKSEINLFNVSCCYWLIVIGNGLLIFTLIFGALYSLLLLPYVIFNLFSLGQVNSAFYTNKKFPRQSGNDSEHTFKDPHSDS